jgi:hypothetical protein
MAFFRDPDGNLLALMSEVRAGAATPRTAPTPATAATAATAEGSAIWGQMGAAIDMLENAIVACPEDLWREPTRGYPFWGLAHHTLFWLDLYLSGAVEGFAPPPPFGLDELESSGLLPPRVYTKEEVLGHLEHCRRKGRVALEGMSAEAARRICRFRSWEMPYAELQIYNLRHVQHGAAQMNYVLRQRLDSAPRWVGRTGVRRG